MRLTHSLVPEEGDLHRVRVYVPNTEGIYEGKKTFGQCRGSEGTRQGNLARDEEDMVEVQEGLCRTRKRHFPESGGST